MPALQVRFKKPSEWKDRLGYCQSFNRLPWTFKPVSNNHHMWWAEWGPWVECLSIINTVPTKKPKKPSFTINGKAGPIDVYSHSWCTPPEINRYLPPKYHSVNIEAIAMSGSNYHHPNIKIQVLKELLAERPDLAEDWELLKLKYDRYEIRFVGPRYQYNQTYQIYQNAHNKITYGVHVRASTRKYLVPHEIWLGHLFPTEKLAKEAAELFLDTGKKKYCYTPREFKTLFPEYIDLLKKIKT